MMSLVRYLCLLVCLLCSQVLWADVWLPGSFYVGDNRNDALRPTTMVGNYGGGFFPVAPIHFSLSESQAISEIRVEGQSGLHGGVNIVIWNAYGSVVVDAQASLMTPDRVTGLINLPAGEYRMAVWGGCYSNGYYLGRFWNNCQDWDDFRFSGIRLVSSGSSHAVHFIERTHIGDNVDANRWYPPAPSGTYVKLGFTLPEKSRLDNLTLYNLRDWSIANGSRMFIRTQGSVDTPLVFYFSGNGDVNWDINYELSAGNYELWIETLSRADRDDISWDDIILRYTPIPAVTDFAALCQQAFPYPVQGRNVNHYLDLGGSHNGPPNGFIWGTKNGSLGYYNSSMIKGSYLQACDRDQCLPAGNTSSLSLPASRFPLPGGSNLRIPYDTHYQLTAANGNRFGLIETSYMASLDIQQAGLYIKNLRLDGGRGGKPYTVRLAAGDYWIEELWMDSDTSIVLDGPVRLFVKSLVMDSANLINSPGVNRRGDINQLLLVSYGQVVMDNLDTISGLLYQIEGSSLYMGSNSYWHGRVSSASVVMGYHSVIDSSGYECESVQQGPDHYELYYPSLSLTCEGASIQLLACQNNNCSQRYVNGAQVTLSPASGWSSNPVTIGASGLAALTLSRLTSGNVTLGLTSSAPSAPLRCYRDGVLDNNCSMSFTDAALRFDFSTFYAGDTASTTIRAIRSNDAGATRVCVPLLTGNQTLQFGHAKLVSEPTSSSVPSINDSALTPTGSVNVLFDGNGVGQLALKYPDAGVLRLDATFQKSDTTGTLTLTGSDTVAVIPSAIVLQGEGQSACDGSDDAKFAECSVYKKAGEEYDLLSRAVNRQGELTPGFAASNLTLEWGVVAPQAGQRGVLTPASITLSAGQGRTPASWSEVGVLQAGVSNFIPYPGYQTESPQLEVPLRWSSPIGRFVPWDFNLVRGDIIPACGEFSYMGQPFGVKLEIMARNKAGDLTQNYKDAFAKGSAYLTTANDRDGHSLSTRLRNLPSLPWENGLAKLDEVSAFLRLSETQPDGPYQSLLFGLYMHDHDGDHTLIADPDFNEVVQGACSSGQCNARLIDTAAMTAYFGRVSAGTEAGLASAPLAIVQQMQYYQAGNWRLNTQDQCTALSLANGGFSFPGAGQHFDEASRDLDLGDNRKIRLGLGRSAPGGVSAIASDGELLFHFAPPGIAVRIPYRIDLARQPAASLWLSDPDSLQGEAIFGSARGNDRIIYRREVLN
ncbi:DUF6701 domain-containing protein [Aeromonas enteropelogenes]|uniref:DUF6701 domain-containing protein n=1 Tax=Aeromonas enteropelogenes TaxID=29489 RepID=UPI000F537088|nr:DUF6701 domain-containing protein [Aeromonas enteropelogenes]RQM64197.1 hypothetical protein EHZ64_11910 [Aeromonas enteropelogenes]